MSVPYEDLGNGVVIQRDVVYNRDSSRPLTLHLLRPSAPPTSPLPVVVYIFGGAFRHGNKESGIPHVTPLVQRGYACACVEYRLSGEVKFPAPIHDVKCAVRFLRASASELGLAAERIGAWGHSSGGYLATMLGVTAGRAEFEGTGGWPEWSSAVQAVCDFFGPTDFLQMNRAGSTQDHDAADSPESELIGGPIQERPAEVTRANPITYVRDGHTLPPFLIVHGDRDPLVPFNQSELLAEAMSRVHAEFEFRRVVEGGHGGPQFESPERMERVGVFFDKNIRQ
jgi:acetyl esterase/lipase